jgi:antitoxin component HigA of HigAB toxin-antitoxin module
MTSYNLKLNMKSEEITGAWIRSKMAEYGYTQKTLGEAIGKGQSSISEIISGYRGKQYCSARVAIYYFFELKKAQQ